MKNKIKFTKETFGLSLILLLSAILNFANLGIEGYANTYYAAGVKSMMMNLKNFFFVSFDPTGFVTIDKPPLGFWIQTVSAKIFGFSGWSIIFPQALAGVISVGLIYYLVKRSFGSIAGLTSALCLSVTPIFVAASRNNTIDNLLVLSLLLSCWVLSIAAEKGKLKYLIISLIFVGIGFNIKMLEAYMVAPALYITYLLSSAIPIKRRISHLAAGTVVLLLVSLSWALIVDLVPTADRPFVGSSSNNTVMELIVGHNGLERLGVRDTSKFGGNNSENKQYQGQRQMPMPKEGQQGNGNSGFNEQNRNMSYFNGGAGIGNSSTPGITRLFAKNNVSDQIVWLLPLALFGFFAAAIKENLKLPFDNKRKLSLILWFAWLLPEFIYFSFTKGMFHTYYLTTMAPSIAALVGIGLSAMWELYKEGQWKSWILPLALIIDGLVQMRVISYNYGRSDNYKIIILITGILCFVPSVILVIANIINRMKEYSKNTNIVLKKILTIVAFIGLLIAPVIWSFTTVIYQMNGSSPFAGLELSSSGQRANIDVNNNSKLIKFLESSKTNEEYLVAVPSAQAYASDIILETSEPVMTFGGFSGSDKIINIDKFKQLVKEGHVRYVMVSQGGMRGGMRGNSNDDIINWVKKNGKIVPEKEWKDVDSNNQASKSANNSYRNSGNNRNNWFGGRDSVQLYDLRSNNETSIKK